MLVLDQIQKAATIRELRFLVIGGVAVIEHGYPRLTFDLDLLTVADARPAWRRLLTDLGYAPFEQQDHFEQYARREGADWPVDLMFVSPETFEGLSAEAEAACIQGVSVALISLKHLFALKLHALKQGRFHRFLKDFQDVVELVRIRRLNLHEPGWRDHFLRYGSSDLYEKILRGVSS